MKRSTPLAIAVLTCILAGPAAAGPIEFPAPWEICMETPEQIFGTDSPFVTVPGCTGGMVTVAAMAPIAGVLGAAVALPRPWSMPMAVFNVVHISSLFTIQAGALIAGAPFWAIQQPVEFVVERVAL